MRVTTMGKRRVFYGWYIVAACVLVAGAGIGFHNTAGIFLRPVTEDLGFSRGEFTFFRTISAIISVLVLPVYGRMARQYSIKKIMFIGTSVNALSLAAYSLCTDIWHFYLLAVINGLVVGAGNFMIIGILVSRWFEDKNGLALGIAYAGSGLGAAVMNPMANYVIHNFGWRWAFAFSGIISLVVLIPAILIMIKDTPESMGLQPYRTGNLSNLSPQAPENDGVAFRTARRTPIFWLLALSLLGLSISASAPTAHTPAHLGDLGYSAGTISAVVALCMVFLTLGKILMGYIFDRFGTIVGGVALGVFAILSPTFALLALYPAAPWLHTIFLGLASTGFSLAVNIYASKFFGKKDFPAIISSLSVVTALGIALSPTLMGLIYDFLGSYDAAWIILIIIGFVVMSCLLCCERLHKLIKIRGNSCATENN